MTPDLPTAFLIVSDDVLGPMRDATLALQAVQDLLTLIATSEQAEAIDADTAEFLSKAFWQTSRTIKAAMTRIDTLDAEVLVPRPDLTTLDMVELWKARAAREAAARAQDIAEVSR